MTAIGGRDAPRAVARIIAAHMVQGPGLAAVMQDAARLRCRLPEPLVPHLLRHPDPAIRADAASLCTSPGPRV
jgi:hypothetical protein